MSAEKEEWRIVPSYPQYQASSLGNIIGIKGYVLKQWVDPYGYCKVCVHHGGRQIVPGVHQLICESFHGPRPSKKHQVAHYDGIKTNNKPDNLRWATSKENHDDKYRHGTFLEEERHPREQLTRVDVSKIKSVYAANRNGRRYVKRGTRENLAAQFGVKISLIKDIVAGRCWRGVE